jgi:hypothetical protein
MRPFIPPKRATGKGITAVLVRPSIASPRRENQMRLGGIASLSEEAAMWLPEIVELSSERSSLNRGAGSDVSGAVAHYLTAENADLDPLSVHCATTRRSRFSRCRDIDHGNRARRRTVRRMSCVARPRGCILQQGEWRGQPNE